MILISFIITADLMACIRSFVLSFLYSLGNFYITVDVTVLGYRKIFYLSYPGSMGCLALFQVHQLLREWRLLFVLMFLVIRRVQISSQFVAFYCLQTVFYWHIPVYNLSEVYFVYDYQFRSSDFHKRWPSCNTYQHDRFFLGEPLVCASAIKFCVSIFYNRDKHIATVIFLKRNTRSL